MGGVLHRTIFIGPGNDGYTRIADWTRVLTSIGAMYEPRYHNRQISAKVGQFDWTEMFNRIDAVEGFNPSGPMWGDGTIGGDLVPVTGY